MSDGLRCFIGAIPGTSTVKAPIHQRRKFQFNDVESPDISAFFLKIRIIRVQKASIEPGSKAKKSLTENQAI
jgi:hypothetical protein